MARARMLHGSISNSERVARLSCDGARLLFTWLIPHADNLGRMRAEPIQLKAVVLPRHPATLKQIEAWTNELADAELIVLYSCQGQRFLEVENWNRFQRLSGNMRQHSDLPARTDGVRTAYVQRTYSDGTCTNGVSPEVEVEVEVESNSLVQTEDPDHLTVDEWFEEEFWPLYPRREGKAKALVALRACFRSVGRSGEDALGQEIMAGLRSHCERWQGKDRQFIPLPASWIHGRRWEDELAEA